MGGSSQRGQGGARMPASKFGHLVKKGRKNSLPVERGGGKGGGKKQRQK